MIRGLKFNPTMGIEYFRTRESISKTLAVTAVHIPSKMNLDEVDVKHYLE